MINFPEKYSDTIKKFILAFYNDRKWQIEQSFLGIQIPVIDIELLCGSALADQLNQIARAAAGDIDRSDEDAAGEVQECIQGLCEWLFAPPGLYSSYHIPGEFWECDLGQMVARAMIWLERDELITLVQAAEIRHVTVQAISQAVSQGKLRSYIDPDARQRQGRTLVRKGDVQEFGD